MEPRPLYTTDDGTPVTTQSMVKTFLACPREAYYKYYLRLKPKQYSKPLTRGSWIHECLEAFYKGKDWEAVHAKWTSDFLKMFIEERQELGDLPREIHNLLESYFWHYSDDPWDVIETELLVERVLPNGHLFRGKIDFIVKSSSGDIWIGDHKTHKRLPDWSFRELDPQSSYYLWAIQPWAEERGYRIKGFVWNYLTTEAIKEPQLVMDGTRFSRRKGQLPSTDYPTLLRVLRENGLVVGNKLTPKLSPAERELIKADLKNLKADKFNPSGMPTSPFFRRDYLVKTPDQLDRAILPLTRVSDMIHSYDWEPDAIPRNISSCKGYTCQYKDLNMADLLRGDSTLPQRNSYTTHDPLEYYGTGGEEE